MIGIMKSMNILLFLSLAYVVACQSPVPVVIWHGMGDSCCDPRSMGWLIDMIKKEIPGVYVYSVALSSVDILDRERSFLANMNDEIANICETIAKDPKLANGYNAMGFSQGGQFLRAIAQRCPSPQMKTLVTFGGQHQGINGRRFKFIFKWRFLAGMPECDEDNLVCVTARRLLDIGAYVDYVQHGCVQAQYFHDSDDEQKYREKSIFLADINNENTINSTYRDNLLKLENLVLVKFAQDEMVLPRESSWFGFYKENDIDTVLLYNQTRLYTEDRIGLKTLEERGRLHFLTMEGDHLQIDKTIFVNDIINVYFK